MQFPKTTANTATGIVHTGENDREKLRAARVSIASNGVLVALKVAVGLATGSVAVLAEAVHSTTDLLAALVAFFAVRAASVPPDADHPYGHGKMESLSSLLEAVFIVGAAIYIFSEAIGTLRADKPTAQPTSWLAIGVMAISAVVNYFVVRYLFAVARKTDSPALEADARHLSVDIWTSVGVLVGLLLSRWTNNPAVDPIVAMGVSGFVLHIAVRIVREAVAPLSDAVLPVSEVRAIEEIIHADAQILDFHKLRTRKAGSQRHVDVHIQVDDEMSLKDAHDLTEALEDKIRAALPNVQVVIHTEPYEEERQHHAGNPH